MIIAQISDPHISLPGSMPDIRWHTAAHLERAVTHIASLNPQPDIVVLTGDCVDGGTPEEYQRLRSILAELRMPYFLAMGNHDNREAMRSVFSDQGWVPDEGFIQYAVDADDLRLVVLDTHIPGKPGGTLCTERLTWLSDRLSEDPARPTLIFLHHPPFSTAMQFVDAMGLDATAELGAVIERFDNVELLSAGHVHRPIQHRFFGTIAMTCPSTSHQAVLDLEPVDRLAFVDEPPACLLHCWSAATGLVSHTSYIRDCGPEDLLYDGKRWFL